MTAALYQKALVWIRRDMRLHDQRALSQATQLAEQVYVVFVFDEHILGRLPSDDRRVTFLAETLEEMDGELRKRQGGLIVKHGKPEGLIPALIEELDCQALFFNEDFESYAKLRDQKVTEHLLSKGIGVHTFLDHVFYDPNRFKTGKNETYKVFTPFKRRWLEAWALEEYQTPSYSPKREKLVAPSNATPVSAKKWLTKLNFQIQDNVFKGGTQAALKQLKKFEDRIRDYHEARDFPALDGTSNLSVHLRFGTLSIRDCLQTALKHDSRGGQVWLSELIWREFYHMILNQFPHVETNAFKSDYQSIPWKNSNKELQAWKEGQTGFPLVDAAMRCLNATGTMPNRLRMVTASFLCKTLLIDWKKGESYFAEKLLDFDLASNNGGWQWCSSTGTDAQPYFRIFNPWTQSKKFDEHGHFIRKWCPELAEFSNKLIHQPEKADMFEQAAANCQLGQDYPFPIVSYEARRIEAVDMYKRGLKRPSRLSP